VAPAGTPREIIIKLNNAIIAALKAPDMQQRVAQIGFEVQTDTPEQFTAVLKSENEIYGPVIKKAGIKID
jgi:tripartite-type tricarboxylate transporter receptor subunit TctC